MELIEKNVDLSRESDTFVYLKEDNLKMEKANESLIDLIPNLME